MDDEIESTSNEKEDDQYKYRYKLAKLWFSIILIPFFILSLYGFYLVQSLASDMNNISKNIENITEHITSKEKN